MHEDWSAKQVELCKRFGVQPFSAPDELKVGIAQNVKEGLQPMNGLRVRPEGDTTGWYIWAGQEWSDAPDLFVPLHVHHLADWCPAALPYLQLPPGWRFLVAPGHEDVWFDSQLLRIPGTPYQSPVDDSAATRTNRPGRGGWRPP